ncbi:MAG: MFS transporter [Actinomycetota bacterium]
MTTSPTDRTATDGARGMPPGAERDPIVLLILGTSLLMGAGSVVFTMLPELQSEVGFPTWGFGLIAGVFFATSLLAQLVLARMADRGHARVLLTAAIGLGVCGLVLMAVGDSLLELTLARGIGGLATGCWAPAARATAISGRPDQTARRLSYIAMGDTSGLVIGPLVGALLAGLFSVDVAFLFFAVLIALLSPVLFRLPITEVRSDTTGTPLRTLARRRPVLQSVALAMALFLPVGLYETIWGKHLFNLGGSTFIVGLSVAAYGLPYVLVAPIGGRLGDRFGSARVALIGAGALVAITVATGFPRNYWVLLGFGVVEAAISAVAYPNALAAVSRACSEDEQATAQGLAGGASIAGAGLMALLAGPIFDLAGPIAAFSTTAALVGVVALAAAAVDRSAFAVAPQPTRTEELSA